VRVQAFVFLLFMLFFIEAQEERMMRVFVLYMLAIPVFLQSPAAFGQLKKGDLAADYGQLDLYADPARELVHWVSDFVGPEAAEEAQKALLISFCASYCVPCWKELPILLAFKEKFGARGFEVWSVLVDEDQEGRAEGKKKLEPANGKIVCTRIGARNMPDKYMGPKWEMPALFLIDSKGVIVATASGLETEALRTMEQAIADLVREK